jgi:hypothetical protein
MTDKDDFINKTNNGNYTFWLSNSQMGDIARVSYGFMFYGDWEGLENFSKDVSFYCFSPHPFIQALEHRFGQYKNKVEQGYSNLTATSVINLGNHWVTLVISHDEKSKKFRAYYCDSFGSELLNEISGVLQKTFGIKTGDIGISKHTQQTDAYSCGPLALKNAKIITDSLKAGKSFDAINKQLKYTSSQEQLKEQRRKFKNALENEKPEASHMSYMRSLKSSAASSESVRGSNSEGTKTQKTEELKKHSTAEDGNFLPPKGLGENNSGASAKTAQDRRDDIKTHSSFGDFKAGMKRGTCAYAGITLASMILGAILIATAPYLIMPFALLMFNPAVWAGVGVACILASGMGESLMKPLIRQIEDKGTSPLGNTLRVASTALAFTLLGPVGGIAVGAVALTDCALKGKLTEVGQDLLSGTGNVLQNLWKGLAEKLLPSGKEEEQNRKKNGKAFTAHASSESVSNAKDQVKVSESFDTKIKKQANELGTPFTDSKHSTNIKNILNRTQQQQSRER